MKNISSNFIMVFSGALAFVAGLLYGTDTSVVDTGFKANMDTLFVPAIIGYVAIVAAVKFKQSKEGLAL